MTYPDADEFNLSLDDESLAGARHLADNLIEQPEFAEPNYDYVDPNFVKPQRRRNGANDYERRIRVGLNTAARFCAGNEATVPDAAALLMHGEQLSQAWGDAAAADKRVGRVIDFLTKPTDDPVSLAFMTTVPLVFQLLRNHEPQLEPTTRGIRIPFRKNPDGTPKRLRFKFGIRLKRLRALTNHPDKLAQHVFTDPRIAESMRKQGIHVAGFIRPE